jgi:hypothetical protein
MPKRKDLAVTKTPKPGDCLGGRSWQFKPEPHAPGKVKDIYCYRCKARMGCSFCCEKARELLCLECHNWATKTAMRYHGNIVPCFKVPRVRTDEGWINFEYIGVDSNPEIHPTVAALLEDVPF